jgi:hypothetical protein
MAVNEAKLNALLGKMVTEMGAALVGASVIIGDQLGLYKALAAHGCLTSAELAARTGTAERYIREWLAGQAASGYLEYDATSERYCSCACPWRSQRRIGSTRRRSHWSRP